MSGVPLGFKPLPKWVVVVGMTNCFVMLALLALHLWWLAVVDFVLVAILRIWCECKGYYCAGAEG